ncbi:MAG TPA: hypothetical protein VF310_12615, partial [Vicinamibacteria bacterium]
MNARGASLLLVLAGLAVGTIEDRHLPPPLGRRGGYEVIAADFHVHSFFGDGALAPWDLAGEARRRGLSAFALTNHNRVGAAHLARWLSRRRGGPIVLVGEEVTHPGHHLIAVGIETVIPPSDSAAETIDLIHAQGGVAIAAHPHARFWPDLDDAALARLDGAERAHPLIFARVHEAHELGEFWDRAAARGRRLAPIGSSDFHATQGLGLCRTYVFAA